MATSTEIRLKLCPFCKGSPRFGASEDGGEYIECQECLMTTKLMYPLKEPVKDSLAESWNDREYENHFAGFRGPNARKDYLTLYHAQQLSPNLYNVLNHQSAVGLTVCPECSTDDFTHTKGCGIAKEADDNPPCPDTPVVLHC